LEQIITLFAQPTSALHSKPAPQTALLLFANKDRHEALQKPFFGVNAPKKNCAFSKELNLRSLAVARRSGLPVFRFTEREQVGNTFGERLAHAIQRVFDQGITQVVVMGNDTPQLRPSHLLAVEKALSKANWVVGPAMDGGLYVLGVQKAAFEPITFAKMPWQTPDLFAAFLDLDPVLVLPEVFGDIDTAPDFRFLASDFRFPKPLRARLAALQATPTALFSLPPTIAGHCYAVPLRGPPIR